MSKLIIIFSLLVCTVLGTSCSNNENTPAKAGTSASDGVGSEVDKGTSHGKDSAAINVAPPDSANNK